MALGALLVLLALTGRASAAPCPEAPWVTVAYNRTAITSSSQEKAPAKTCASFTEQFGCRYRNFCCWNSTTELSGPLCVPSNMLLIECVGLGIDECATTQSGGEYICFWDSTLGICRRLCPDTEDPDALCAAVELQLPTAAPTSATALPTATPAASSAAPVNASDLAAWRALFSATSGAAWTQCSGDYASPCACSGAGGVSVTCEPAPSAGAGAGAGRRRRLREEEEEAQSATSMSITGVSLPGNNLKGALTSSLLSAFGNLQTLNLAGNPQLTMPPGTSCLSVPQCWAQGASCEVSPPALALCAAPAPSPSSGGGGLNPGIIVLIVIIVLVALLACALFARHKVRDVRERNPEKLPPWLRGNAGAPPNDKLAASVLGTDGGAGAGRPASVTVFVPPEDAARAKPANGVSHFSLLRSADAPQLERNASLTAAKSHALMVESSARMDVDTVADFLENLNLGHLWPRFKADGRFVELHDLLLASKAQLVELGLNVGERAKLEHAISQKRGESKSSLAAYT